MFFEKPHSFSISSGDEVLCDSIESCQFQTFRSVCRNRSEFMYENFELYVGRIDLFLAEERDYRFPIVMAIVGVVALAAVIFGFVISRRYFTSRVYVVGEKTPLTS